MIEQKLEQILAIVQGDPGNRGLAADARDNLITATAGDFVRACRNIATHPSPRIAIITGFTIPSADPPCGETDGPLGALYLARALSPLSIPVTLASDGTTMAALRAGVAAAELDHRSGTRQSSAERQERKSGDYRYEYSDTVPVVELPDETDPDTFRQEFYRRAAPANILIALERVGPSHSDGRCYSMRGREMTHLTRPAHYLFDNPGDAITIGIGDGGNEIGMGKIPRPTIARNIANGDKVGCCTPTNELIVAGISNWGAYALATGVRVLRGVPFDASLFDTNEEHRLLQIMIDAGPLIDGVTAQRTLSVDGLSFDEYFGVMAEIMQFVQ